MYKAPDIRCCALQRIPRIHFHNLGVSLISAPQQVSEIYTTVCPFNFTHFIVKLRAGRRIIPGSYVISILTFSFSFFFSVHGLVSMDQFGFQMIQILSHYFLVVTGQLLPHLKCEASCTALNLKKQLHLSLLGVEWQPKFWLTSPLLWLLQQTQTAVKSFPAG